MSWHYKYRKTRSAPRQCGTTRISQRWKLNSHPVLVRQPFPFLRLFSRSKYRPDSSIHCAFDIGDRVLDAVDRFHLWAAEGGRDDEAGDVVEVAVGDDKGSETEGVSFRYWRFESGYKASRRGSPFASEECPPFALLRGKDDLARRPRPSRRNRSRCSSYTRALDSRDRVPNDASGPQRSRLPIPFRLLRRLVNSIASPFAFHRGVMLVCRKKIGKECRVAFGERDDGAQSRAGCACTPGKNIGERSPPEQRGTK